MRDTNKQFVILKWTQMLFYAASLNMGVLLNFCQDCNVMNPLWCCWNWYRHWKVTVAPSCSQPCIRLQMCSWICSQIQTPLNWTRLHISKSTVWNRSCFVLSGCQASQYLQYIMLSYTALIIEAVQYINCSLMLTMTVTFGQYVKDIPLLEDELLGYRWKSGPI